jgi:hypothetical protein
MAAIRAFKEAVSQNFGEFTYQGDALEQLLGKLGIVV